MKTIIRAFVAALVITGAAATAHVSAQTSNVVTVAKTSAMPIPVCPPDDPNACGIGQGNGTQLR